MPSANVKPSRTLAMVEKTEIHTCGVSLALSKRASPWRTLWQTARTTAVATVPIGVDQHLANEIAELEIVRVVARLNRRVLAGLPEQVSLHAHLHQHKKGQTIVHETTPIKVAIWQYGNRAHTPGSQGSVIAA